MYFLFLPFLISFLGTNVLCLAKSLLFNGGMGRQTESGKMFFSESETGKCLTSHNGIMWHDFQAGKHVHFLVFAFMWGGGVVSIFHIKGKQSHHTGKDRYLP